MAKGDESPRFTENTISVVVKKRCKHSKNIISDIKSAIPVWLVSLVQVD
jgi:hypothetical protein